MAQNSRMRVAVDAMGGDFAPKEVVRGAVLAAQKGDVEIILVGSPDALKQELAGCDSTANSSVRIVEAAEVIRENEPPVMAIRGKTNSSVSVAARVVESGEADAMVSAGSSAAAAISAMQFIGLLDGVYRPAIVGHLGSFAPNTVMVDLGANVDCKPHQLLTFAIFGCVYTREFLKVRDPKVALLSTGIEESKGSEAVREAHLLLKNSGLNFVGNIEGSDIFSGKANVIVCDGFIGNVILKFYESIPDYARNWTAQRLKKYPPLSAMVKLMFDRMFPANHIARHSETEGGILWGVDGVVRIAHGASQAAQIANAIASARRAVRADVVGKLRLELEKFRQEGKL